MVSYYILYLYQLKWQLLREIKFQLQENCDKNILKNYFFDERKVDTREYAL
jgi:hypothetical protein